MAAYSFFTNFASINQVKEQVQFIKDCKRIVCLALYYCLATHLPRKGVPFFGKMANRFRCMCVQGIFKRCGRVSTIGKGAYFGTGRNVEIGDYSGIGDYCTIPNNAKIGKYVMMGPEVFMTASNHVFASTDKPMIMQGMSTTRPIEIEDDCWIGARVIITPGRKIGRGSIVGAGAVVTKDVEQFSIVGGNPAKAIKSRKDA